MKKVLVIISRLALRLQNNNSIINYSINYGIVVTRRYANCMSFNRPIKSKALGHTRTKSVKLIDDQIYLLTEMADDDSYGYHKSNRVKVGGSRENNGPQNERRF